MSSLRRGHANLLCIIPILTDDPRRESRMLDLEQHKHKKFWVSFLQCIALCLNMKYSPQRFEEWCLKSSISSIHALHANVSQWKLSAWDSPQMLGAPLPLSLTAAVVWLMMVEWNAECKHRNKWINDVVVCTSRSLTRKHNHGNSAPSRKSSCYFLFIRNKPYAHCKNIAEA